MNQGSAERDDQADGQQHPAPDRGRGATAGAVERGRASTGAVVVDGRCHAASSRPNRPAGRNRSTTAIRTKIEHLREASGA